MSSRRRHQLINPVRSAFPRAGLRYWPVRDSRLCQWRFWRLCLSLLPALFTLLLAGQPAEAQSFRFIIRAEPNVIPANGVSTTSILVQVLNTGGVDLSSSQVVRFITTSGAIESQVPLTGGVARARLRSSSTPGTALVTAIIGSAREEVEVQFSADIGEAARYLEVAGPYVDYNSETGLVSASGLTVLDFGDLHIEGDVRMVVNLFAELVWVEGTSGAVIIRRGKGSRAATVRGDRLFYDMRRMQGVMRRADSTDGPLREEFEGYNLQRLEPLEEAENLSPQVDDDAPRVLAIDEVASRMAMEQALSANDGLELASRDADVLPLLPPTGKLQATVSPTAAVQPADATAVSTPDVSKRASIWLNGTGGGSGPLAKIFTISQDSEAIVGSEAVGGEALGVDATDGEAANSEAANDEAADEGAAGETMESIVSPPAAIGAEPDSSYRPIEPVPPVEMSRRRFNEPVWPELHRDRGYWITARRIRVFPHDKIQFERSTVFFNGTKLFAMPLYVLPLTSSLNPVAGMVGFNSSGGLRLNVPFYYMASPHGTGAVYLQHAPGSGFAAEKPGFALALEQQYYLSRNSFGRFYLDQIGRGGWNLNWEHSLQISPTTTSRLYVNMPRHKDLYTYGTVVKDFSSVQVGLEGSYNRPEASDDALQGQIFARLRPKGLGKSGWVYTVSANALARRYTDYTQTFVPGTGGGIALPGQPRPGTSQLEGTPTRLFGQTVNLSLQSPTYRPWSGSSVQATVLSTAFNYSDGRRGVAPGLLLGWRQSLGNNASLQLNYSYDKGAARLYNVDFTHYVSGALSMSLGQKIAANAFVTHSFSDGSLYGTAGLDYYFRPKWRLGLFSDYTSFGGSEDYLNYGFTLGRLVGQREVSVNWDSDRGRFYLELGGFRL